MNSKWTENDKNFLRENANKMKDIEIAQALTESTGRKVSLEAVRKQRQKLGIKKAAGRGIVKVVV